MCYSCDKHLHYIVTAQCKMKIVQRNWPIQTFRISRRRMNFSSASLEQVQCNRTEKFIPHHLLLVWSKDKLRIFSNRYKINNDYDQCIYVCVLTFEYNHKVRITFLDHTDKPIIMIISLDFLNAAKYNFRALQCLRINHSLF